MTTRRVTSIKTLDDLSKRDQERLKQLGAGALEELQSQRRREQEHLEQRREQIAEAERVCREIPREQRTMDARDRVAAQVAAHEGIDHTQAQRFVARCMEESRARR